MMKRQIHACNDYRYPLLGTICVQSHAEIKLNPVLQIVSGDETIDWTPLIKSPYKLEGNSVLRGYLSKSRILGYTFETSMRVDVSRRLPVDVDPPPPSRILS